MELKNYQQKVIGHLNDFLATLEQYQRLDIAFREYWAERGATGMPAYQNNVKGIPHVCIKVPTAGGKTFIAVNALEHLFNALQRPNPQRPKLVVWLVPSLTILEQTYRQLDDPQHPYRQKLNERFSGRVAVYQKQDLLTAANFNADTVREQLSIVVMSFDSLRARNKDDRKIYQGNGYLANFLNATWYDTDCLLPEHEPDSLINVLRPLRPLVVVDESHNAESALSVEMLANLNPAFILDLTATPRKNSNIISYVDAMQLKNQHMVKLPVLVSNQPDKNRVIENALKLRRELEGLASQQEKSGGRYIRPIVLFQAQPRTADDNTTFEKLRETLVELQIPAEQIKIKTAQINELKDIDLLSRDCPVRYIITVNALKEGWDCPFAYVLASLADKSSTVDVEQILGRVLRMPYVQTHTHNLLNLSYVFTASSRFTNTLDNIVSALNRAGFSQRDFRTAEPILTIPPSQTVNTQPELPLKIPTVPSTTTSTLTNEAEHDTIDPSKINLNTPNSVNELDTTASHDSTTPKPCADPELDALKQQAEQANRDYEQEAKNNDDPVPPEQERHMNYQKMQERWKQSALNLKLPQFFTRVATGGFFSNEEALHLFDGRQLLKGFKLSEQAIDIDFATIDEELRLIDLQQIGKEGDEDYRAECFKVDTQKRAALHEMILKNPLPSQQREVSQLFFNAIGKQDPIPEAEVKAYIKHLVESFSKEQVADALANDALYIRKIKEKIKALSESYIEKQFYYELDIEKIFLNPYYTLPIQITPRKNAPPIQKSLYQHEEEIGVFEREIIEKIADLDNVLWWHKNPSRKGFYINGAINHYPDFILYTKNGKVILIETKGDHLDGSDSATKLKLGKEWASKAGNQFRYLMVFESNTISGADTLADALKKLKNL
ncbi:MAG: RNA helicase [Thiothrix sp.]|nr:MAG: RNA helicase [Thiothrix sp.]